MKFKSKTLPDTTKASAEKKRLDALTSYAVMDTPPEPAFDDLVYLASEICGTPISLVSLLDETRQWFKARVGLEATETPRNVAFCAHAIESTGTFIVPDASKDNRFNSNILVTNAPKIRFYAGVPLTTDEGFKLGTLCVIDTVPRNLTDKQVRALEALARQVVDQLELRRKFETLRQFELANQVRDRDLRKLLDEMPVGVFHAELTGEWFYANQTWTALTGMSMGDSLGEGWLKCVHPEDQRLLKSKLLINGARNFTADIRVSNIEGETRWLRIRSNVWTDDTGKTAGYVGTVLDFTKHKEADDRLKHSYANMELEVAKRTKELSALVQAIPQIVWISDQDGKSNYLNPRWYEYIGKKDQSPDIGSEMDFIHPDDREHVSERWEKAFAKATLFEAEYRLKKFTGEYRWHLARSVPLFNEEGLVTSWMGTSTDIQAQKETESLRASQSSAIETSRLKSGFLANMSHEIRTPLNGILGMTDLISETALSDEQSRYAKILKLSGEHLLSLINDILDFSKIEAGKLLIENTDFDLTELVEAQSQLFTAKLREKGLTLNTYIDSGLPTFFIGDSGRIAQILLNLISNAIKFTQSGTVTVRAKLVQDTTESTSVRISVDDTGVGMNLEVQRRLFQPFVQADGTTARRFGGSGLGLSISKSLVEMMGGEIGIKSVENQGSSFWFTLNLAKSKRANRASTAKDFFLKQNRKFRVLVIDDDPAACEIYKQYLSAWGIEFLAIQNPRKALAFLEISSLTNLSFDVAIVDYRMPEINGVELGNKIKSTPALANTKLILASSMAPASTVSDESFFNLFHYRITKPIRKNTLFQALTTVLELGNELEREASNSAVRSIKGAAVAPYTAKNILVVEDNEVNQILTVTLLEKLGCIVTVAKNGIEAVEATKNKSFDVIFMDCQMPEMDGYEATRRIREQEKATGTHTPIIALTAHAMKEDETKCLEAGMDAYLTKPIKKERLAESIVQWTTPEILRAA